MMFDLGFEVKPVLVIDAKATEDKSPQERNWKAEAHRCGISVGAGRDQISENTSAQNQKRRKCHRFGNEAAQQSGNYKALSHIGVHEHQR